MPRGKNREQILDAGLSLMYAKGYNASGVQKIANISGVPKGSFYNYFKSKEDFAIQALERYTENVSAYLKKVLIDGEKTPLARLRELFDDWAENQFTKYEGCGCFAGNLSQEIANHSPAVRKAIDLNFTKLESFYVACLEEAQRVGEIDENVNPKQLGAFIFNAWQGALIRAKAQGNPEPLKLFKRLVFESLLT